MTCVRPAVERVLITGAGTGLGRRTALHLAGRGLRVYAGVLLPEQMADLDTAAREIGAVLRPLHLDITDPASVDAAVRLVTAECDGIDALVNNAGTRLRGCHEDLADEELRRLFDVNIFGTMAVTRAVIPHMRRKGRGRIVMVTSIAGRIGSFGVSAYCATKFAQEGLGECLAHELAPWGIRVITVAPAIVNTEAWGRHRVTARRAADPRSPYFRWFQRAEALADRMVASSPTTPEDVAQAIHKALTVGSPRLRYVVGRRARMVATLRRRLPGELFEKIYFRQLLRLITRGEAKSETVGNRPSPPCPEPLTGEKDR